MIFFLFHCLINSFGIRSENSASFSCSLFISCMLHAKLGQMLISFRKKVCIVEIDINDNSGLASSNSGEYYYVHANSFEVANQQCTFKCLNYLLSIVKRKKLPQDAITSQFTIYKNVHLYLLLHLYLLFYYYHKYYC